MPVTCPKGKTNSPWSGHVCPVLKSLPSGNGEVVLTTLAQTQFQTKGKVPFTNWEILESLTVRLRLPKRAAKRSLCFPNRKVQVGEQLTTILSHRNSSPRKLLHCFTAKQRSNKMLGRKKCFGSCFQTQTSATCDWTVTMGNPSPTFQLALRSENLSA